MLTPPDGRQPHADVNTERRDGRRRGTARKLRPALESTAERHSAKPPAPQSPAEELVSQHEAGPGTDAAACGSLEHRSAEREREAGSMPRPPDGDGRTAAEDGCRPDALATSPPEVSVAGSVVEGVGGCGTAAQIPDVGAAEDADGAVACDTAAEAAEPAASPVSAVGNAGEVAVAGTDPAAAPKRRRKLGRNRAVLDSPDPYGPPRPSYARSQVRCRRNMHCCVVLPARLALLAQHPHLDPDAIVSYECMQPHATM